MRAHAFVCVCACARAAYCRPTPFVHVRGGAAHKHLLTRCSGRGWARALRRTLALAVQASFVLKGLGASVGPENPQAPTATGGVRRTMNMNAGVSVSESGCEFIHCYILRK